MGICIFLFLTRRLPFWVTSNEPIFSKIMKLTDQIGNDEPYIPAFIPATMRSTLEQVLHKNPRYRMTLRQAMRNLQGDPNQTEALCCNEFRLRIPE